MSRPATSFLAYSSPVKPDLSDSSPAPVGLCLTCAHSRKIESDRGSLFFLCKLSEANPAFPKYPRLPVFSCPGYTAAHNASPRS